MISIENNWRLLSVFHHVTVLGSLYSKISIDHWLEVLIWRVPLDVGFVSDLQQHSFTCVFSVKIFQERN